MAAKESTAAKVPMAAKAAKGTIGTTGSYRVWEAFGALWWKEISAMVQRPLLYILTAWVVGFYFLLMFVFIFLSGIIRLQEITESFLLMVLFLNVLIAAPVLAREQRQGTLDLLLSTPMRESTIVLAKYSALLLYYTGVLVSTLPAYLYLSAVTVFPVSLLVLQYILIWLFGATVLALGVWFSALARREATAAIWGICFALFAVFLNSSLSYFPIILRKIFSIFILLPQTQSFTHGILTLDGILYYVIMSTSLILLSIHTVQTKRWD